MTMDDKLKLGGIATGALVLGALTASIIKGTPDTDVPVTLEPIPAGVVKAAPAPEPPAAEPTGPLTTDIDSPLTQPGERVMMEVNLRDGWAPVSEFTRTGDGAECFNVVASQMIGKTLKVLAQNDCATPMRFAATFQYDKAR